MPAYYLVLILFDGYLYLRHMSGLVGRRIATFTYNIQFACTYEVTRHMSAYIWSEPYHFFIWSSEEERGPASCLSDDLFAPLASALEHSSDFSLS
jgi:hypothetical protein